MAAQPSTLSLSLSLDPHLTFLSSSFLFDLQKKKTNRSRRSSGAPSITRAVVERPAVSGGAASIASRSPSSSVLAVILGGGAGTRLYPLTKQRAKPAVPIGGAYRLIDVPMSNCINSGINKIYVMTQFNSTSLNRHLARTYNVGSGVRFGGDGFVEVLAATQTPTDKEWFQGTADAVRQYAWLFSDTKVSEMRGLRERERERGSAAEREERKRKRKKKSTTPQKLSHLPVVAVAPLFLPSFSLFKKKKKNQQNRTVEDVVVLSGDHLYRMDYLKFVEHHRATGADITIGALPVERDRASDFGLMKVDDSGRIVEFAEKPKGAALDAMRVDTTTLGLDAAEAERKPFMASMGCV